MCIRDRLKGTYGILMLILAVIMIRHVEHGAIESFDGDGGGNPAPRSVDAAAVTTRTITANDGRVYTFPAPRHGKGAFATALGAFLTGMVGVGIGEVVMPHLSKRNRVPLPVAAATSVLIVIVTVAAASFTLITTLSNEGGVEAVPWNLVMYTVPAVIIGGQIGPRLQAYFHRHEVFTQVQLERTIGILFAAIGAAMLWLVYRSFAG